MSHGNPITSDRRQSKARQPLTFLAMLCIVHSTLPPPFLGDSAKMHESSEDFFSFFHSRSRRRGQQPEEEMKPPPRLTSAEKRAKRRLGYEPPLMVRRNSFVDKLDKKDPEDKGRN
jgi:hypothetical protein